MPKLPIVFSDIRHIGRHTTERIFSVEEIATFSESGIFLAGIIEARSGFSWMRYNPEVSQLLATVSGEGEVLIANQWRRIKLGMAYLTSAGVPHAYRAIPGKKWTICWLNYLGRPASLSSYFPGAPAIVKFPSKQLWYTLASAGEAIDQHSPPSLLNLCGLLIHQTVLHALKAKGTQQQLRPLWDIVKANPAHHWTLTELAKKSSMSKETLRRVCLRECHYSPLAFVAKLRFEKAVKLLSLGDEKIHVIAEMLGYSDPFTFSTAFKRHMGVCPSKFR